MPGEGSLFGDDEPLDHERVRTETSDNVPPPTRETPVLPHWSEPPTGEIPRVILELSGDHPHWMDSDPQPQPEPHQRPRSNSPRYEDDRSSRSPDGRSHESPNDERERYETQEAAKRVRPPRGKAKMVRGRPKRSRSGNASSRQGQKSTNDAELSQSVRDQPRQPDAKHRTPPSGGRSRSKSTLTGLALGVVVLVGFSLGAQVADVLVTIAIVIAGGEYYSTMRRGGIKPATLVGLVAIVLAVTGSYFRGFPGLIDGLVVGIIVTMVWYLAGLIQTSPLEGISATIFGLSWIGVLGSFASLILRPGDFGGQGVRLMLATLVVTSASDVFAYFGGQFFGKHKLAPSISPSKTYEGLAIGAVAAVVLGYAISGHIHPLSGIDGLILGVVAAVVTPLGDLAESMIKRSLNVKDASQLLPGHGGFLDRIDGVLFMLPVAYFLFRLMHLG